MLSSNSIYPSESAFVILERKKKSLLARVCLALALLSTLSCSAEDARTAPPPAPVDVSGQIAEAERLYARRGESPEHVNEAVGILKQARTSDYENYEILWKLSKYNHFLGKHAEGKERKEAAFDEGIQAGELAISLAPDRPEGHFWLGANRNGRAHLKGPLYAMASVDEVRREMETVLRLDEGYRNGSAYMELATIDLELPGVLGGDSERAVELLERGYEHGKENALYRLRLAEAYYALKRKDDARREAEAVLKMKAHPDYLFEHKTAVAGARRLLAKFK